MRWILAFLLLVFITIAGLAFETNYSQESINSYCSSSNFQHNPPELLRGLSLLSQRQKESGHYPRGWTDLYKCIKVEYQDLSKQNAEGIFFFDKELTAKVFTIYVDNSYKANDDILTASLLAHETMHVRQLKNFQLHNQELSCIDSEIDAYKQQIIFLFLTLNEEEKRALLSRIVLNPSANTSYFNIATLFEIKENAALKAAEKYTVDSSGESLYAKEFWEIANVDVEKMVRESYKEQCNKE